MSAISNHTLRLQVQCPLPLLPSDNDERNCPVFPVRPLTVEMLGSSLSSMSSEQNYDLMCRTYGSRPPANISWWIGSTRLDGHKHTVR